MAQQNKDTNELIKVRRQKLADLQAAGKNPFEIMKYDVTHHSKEIKDNFEELEGKEVAVAGRLMFKRVMGKASFCNVQDLQGGIQALSCSVNQCHFAIQKKVKRCILHRKCHSTRPFNFGLFLHMGRGRCGSFGE